ncbi:MAG: GGDEF domain-containing protein [Acholeplasma sp.]|nr:GGDEF domain-containing protein [Acholeplasma sp.]
MDYAFLMLFSIETVLINVMFVMYYLKSKKRFSTILNVAIFLIILSIIVFTAYFYYDKISNSLRLQAIISLSGIIYVIAFQALYRERIYKIITASGFIWFFTMTGKIFATILVHLLEFDNRNLYLLIIQTCVYIVFSIPFIQIKNHVFNKIFNHSERILGFFSLVISSFIALLLAISLLFNYSKFKIVDLSVLLFITLLAVSILKLMVAYEETYQQKNAWKTRAKIDFLTGIKNRQALFDDFRNFVNLDKKFSVFMLDLDNFKLINDNHGHLKGDEYLIAFSKKINDVIGKNGINYPMSGDEFAVIYFADDYKRLYNEIKKINLKGYIDIDFLGVSLGIVHYPKDAMTINALLDKADNKMYRMKNYKKATV